MTAVTLLEPMWLLLLLPMGAAWWCWPGPTVSLRALRGVLLVLIVLAMTQPTLRLPSRAGTVVVVVDRSLSMPADAESRVREGLGLLEQSMSRQDRLGVVSFGQQAQVEQAPTPRAAGPLAAHEMIQHVGQDASNLAGALDRALSLLPADAPGRILVFSDGIWTGQDPMVQAARAAGREVAIDYRLLSRGQAGDVAIGRIEAPLRVGGGESFMLHALVHNPMQQVLRYDLYRGSARLAGGERMFPAGVTPLTFRDRVETDPGEAGGGGVIEYRLVVHPPPGDPIPENNTARTLVTVTGTRPVLLVTESPQTGLAGLLESGGLNVAVRSAGEVTWSLAELAGHAGVILENVPARAVGHAALTRLAGWIEQAGGGLMLTGGRQSFGPGGYFESPIDPQLPVSMELRQEHRKLSLAVVVALDRSGSMSAGVTGGKTKMDLANLGTAKVLEMLSPFDEFGVLAVDTAPHVIVPFGSVPQDIGHPRQQVLSIAAMGGGIFVEEALTAAGSMLAGAQAGTRHIILFADAADAEQPGRYRELLSQFQQAGITVSVIGLGNERDMDAALLKEIAQLGKGRVFFTDDPHRLPELFAQDLFVVARSSFVEEPAPVAPLAGLLPLTQRTFDTPPPPPVGGYNLTYLRPGANLGMVTQDEYRAPIVAAWQVGLGRAAVYTGEIDGQYTGAIAQWPRIGDLLASLTRWTIGSISDLPEHLVATEQVDRGMYTLDLHVDLSRPAGQRIQAPRLHVLRDDGGAMPPKAQTLGLQWMAADMLRVQVSLSGREVILPALEIPGQGTFNLSPVRLVYSPEFAPQQGEGRETLAQLAAVTDGQQRVDLTTIWQDLPYRPQHLPMAHWLLLIAVAVLVLEVLERRTGIIQWFTSRQRRSVGQPPADQVPVGNTARRPASQANPTLPAPPTPPPPPTPPTPPTPPNAPPTPAGPGLAEALASARHRASQRQSKR